MEHNELNKILFEKMSNEQDSYREWLISQTPKEILKHAYEYIIREDIVMAMEDLDLTEIQTKTLLASPTPLSDVYHYYEDLEIDHMNVIRDSIMDLTDKRYRTHEQQKATPLYLHPAEYAYEHGEMANYNISHQANFDCKKAIEDAIFKNYHNEDYKLNADAAAQEVLQKFSMDRIRYILANTVQKKIHDGRISQGNKEWAKTIPIPEDKNNVYLIADQVNPGLIDILLKQILLIEGDVK